MKNISNLIKAGIIIIDPQTDLILAANSEFAELVGLPKEKIIGNTCNGSLCSPIVGEWEYSIANFLENIDGFEQELQTANGKSISILRTAMLTTINEQEQIVENIIDITDLKNFLNLLKQEATLDPLTQIYNRRVFFELSQQEISLIDRFDYACSIVRIDIDNFKKINDTYGHAAGDIVLKNLAKGFKKHIRSYDILGRLGGDEFGITLVMDTQQQVISMMERLRQAVEEQATVYNDITIKTTISIGIASFDKTNRDFESILIRADKALYQAKNNGRNCVEVFNG